ncbi:amidohydrolase [Paracoccus sp. p3-h83]|uniref:amidohydrolase n=1 Tax=Paracoccus sp. p3-h83 TaxID=3342805 RepID=UPI0035B92686
MLSNADLVELTAWRRDLHRHPDLSGDEGATAARVVQALAALPGAAVVTDLGGHGVAAVFKGAAPGPTVMFRAELDGLPIHEIADLPHRSLTPGRGHMCGHDGHMAMLMGLGRLIARQPPARGRVILLFQPSEEDGAGAAAVLADPTFAALRPDWAFAIHNMPGLPLGHVGLAAGPANCASCGLRAVLTGKTSHASAPEAGLSPAPAIARLVAGLQALGPGGAVVPGYRLATITHLAVGEPTFGVAPGQGEIRVTLRALIDADMADLMAGATALIRTEAARDGLAVEITRHDDFAACTNDAQATAVMVRALEALSIPHDGQGLPMRASEDFGRFGSVAKSAMVLLGAGVEHAMLHNPDYDFPDDLIPVGVALFDRIRRDLLG